MMKSARVSEKLVRPGLSGLQVVTRLVFIETEAREGVGVARFAAERLSTLLEHSKRTDFCFFLSMNFSSMLESGSL